METRKDIPIPHKSKYPFKSLEVGESFDFGEYSTYNANVAGCYCYRRGKTLGRKFGYRRHVAEDGSVRIRIWRTA